MKGRDRFVCIHCGVLLSGRMGRDGLIRPWDRGPDNDEPPKPCVCIPCARSVAREIAAVGSTPAADERGGQS